MSSIDKAITLLDSLIAELKTQPSGPVMKGTPAKEGKGKKATPQKAKDAPAAPSTAPQSEDGELFGAANIQVGRCVTVTDHPNSDKLIKIEVEVAGGEVKKVCAGLKAYVTKEELQGSLVCVIVNLKAAKLGGEPSEAMILAADTPSPEDASVPIVKTLVPPEGAKPGDQVFLEGGSASTSMPKTLKSDKWKKIVPQLTVQGGRACYGGRAMVVSAGPMTVPSCIPDGAGIH